MMMQLVIKDGISMIVSKLKVIIKWNGDFFVVEDVMNLSYSYYQIILKKDSIYQTESSTTFTYYTIQVELGHPANNSAKVKSQFSYSQVTQ